MSFSTDYPAILIFLCLAFALFLAKLMYPVKNGLPEFSTWKLYLLRGLRTGVVFIISVLLLSPVIRIKSVKEENPHMFVLSDNSFSMINMHDSAEVVTEVERLKGKIISELESSFNISWFNFDKEMREGEELSFTGMHSSYSEALKQVNAKYNFLEPAALILIGDGLYNLGENPAGIAKSIEFPIYSMPFGDTVPKTDLSILNIRTKPVVFKNSNFPAEVEIAGKELPVTEVNLTIKYGDKILSSRILNIYRGSYYSNEKFVLDVPEAGILKYNVSVSAVEGETNLNNNSKTITVEAVDDRQKVLILSDGPHPDIGAVKHSLHVAGYETDLAFGSNSANFKPEDYNMLLIYQLPSSTGNNAYIERFFNSKVPRWIFVTGNTHLEELNNYNTGLKIEKPENRNVELFVSYDEKFDHFNIEDEFSELVEVLPPLFAPFGIYSHNTGMQILLKHKVNGTVSDYPAFCVGVNNYVKTAITAGEGIWRWRIREAEASGQSGLFDKMIMNTAKYLALKNNQDNFNIDYSRVINSFDPVKFRAEVLNDVYEFINNAEIAFEIQSSTGDIYNYVFEEGDSGYELDAGNFPAGKYTFSASVETGNKKYRKTGSFEITDNNLEQLNTTANHKILSQISDITGGGMYYPSESDEMIEKIMKLAEEKNNETINENIFDFIHIKYILFLIILIAGAEWLLRRYWGTY